MLIAALPDGPINSWNRESFLFDGPDGKPTVYKMMDTVRQNLILGNYGTLASVDSDDGTCYWSVERNVMLYGSVGMKGWQQGHDVGYSGNVQVLAHGGPGDDQWAQAAGSGYGSGLNSAMLGHGYNYTDNFVIIPAFVNPGGCCQRDWIGTEGFCWANQSNAINGLARVANNTVYYGDTNITECGLLLDEFLATPGATDRGTVAHHWDKDSVALAGLALAAARAALAN